MSTNHNKHKEARTVRELGGEIWAELSSRIPDEELNWQSRNRVIDLLMGILARHQGKIIENDKDLPVKPLGPLEPDSREP